MPVTSRGYLRYPHIHGDLITFVAEDDGEVEVALQWNTTYYEGIHSFANGIATIEGGMHEEGLRKALTNVVNRYARAKTLLKEKDENLAGEDVHLRGHRLGLGRRHVHRRPDHRQRRALRR